MFIITRRKFLSDAATISAAAVMIPPMALSSDDDALVKKWQAMLNDPVYDLLSGKPDLNRILKLFPLQLGEPAFDPGLIRENMLKLKTIPEVDTGHPFLDLSVKTALAHIDATFRGDHPRYGTGVYAAPEHETFPPVIIATVDALSLWGMNIRAAQLFKYWLVNFVKDDGTIKYYGPSLSEYGQLLHTADILEARAGRNGWWDEGFKKLDNIAEYLLRLHSDALKEDGLISGVPEADTRENVARYFHNNAWVARGLNEWAGLCERTKATPSTSPGTVRSSAARLAGDTLAAINRTWPAESSDWWLPARTDKLPHPEDLTDGNEASYTNYRYWPELLSSGLLPSAMANRLVDARLNHGGQFCGMTRFMDWLDDWPLTDYLYGLWALGRRDDYLFSLYGHVAYHQCEEHLTSFEQFSFPGDSKGSKRADYCLPAQLVAARGTRVLNRK